MQSHRNVVLPPLVSFCCVGSCGVMSSSWHVSSMRYLKVSVAECFFAVVVLRIGYVASFPCSRNCTQLAKSNFLPLFSDSNLLKMQSRNSQPSVP